jgi:hypothetical protein
MIPCGKKYSSIGGPEDHLIPESPNENVTQEWEKYQKSKLADHSWDEDHRIQWNRAEIIHKEGKSNIGN